MRRVFDIVMDVEDVLILCALFPKLFDLIDESKSGELDSV